MNSAAARQDRYDLEPFNGITPRGLRVGFEVATDWAVSQPSELTIPVGEARVRVWQSGGSGPAMLFLHAAGATRAVFLRQFDSVLAQNHRLIALDLPQDARSHQPLPLDEQLRLVEAVLDRLDVTCIVPVGWASGAELALALAARRPEVVGVVLTGVDLGRLMPQIGRTGVPVNVIQGADDPVVGAGGQDGEFGRLWRGRRHVIPQAGHAPFLESPQLFNHLLTVFLGDVTEPKTLVEDFEPMAELRQSA